MKIGWVQMIGFGMLLLLAGKVSSGARPATAIEPKMDVWYRETVTLGDVELPAGITIRPSDPLSSPLGSLTLENRTDTLLFVLSLNYKDVLVMATPDPSWESRVRMANEVASYLVAPSHPVSLDMQALADLDTNLLDKNVLSLDPPPTNVAIPAPQDSELLLVYGDQVILVPFMVSYTLNTAFDIGSGANATPPTDTPSTHVASATTQQAAIPAARDKRNSTLVIGLAGLAALLVIGWLLWRSLMRRG